MNLNTKLATIQTKFKSKKSRFNSFGKYYFRSAEDILEATKPYLLDLGVAVTVSEKYIHTENLPIIETTATIFDSENAIHATAIVGVDMNQKGMQMPQKFGSASSYGKKYALGNLFLIDDTADSDASNTHGTDWLPEAKKYLKSGGTMDAIKKKYKVTPEIEKQLTTL
jgi:hypothetical protein|tara:strand:+ start:1022 stop:1525 length:504 start_codon:yes stop_codon:yes gene_type:complete